MVNPAKVRLNRLFKTSGKYLDVAVDYGIFNEYRFLRGLGHLPKRHCFVAL